MAFEIVNEAGSVINSFETKDRAIEFVDNSEEDLAVIDTSNEELVYP